MIFLQKIAEIKDRIDKVNSKQETRKEKDKHSLLCLITNQLTKMELILRTLITEQLQ